MLSICGLLVVIRSKDSDITARYELLFKEFHVSSMIAGAKPVLYIDIEAGEGISYTNYDYELAPFCFLRRRNEITAWNVECGGGYVVIKEPWMCAVIYESRSVTDLTRINLVQIAFVSFLNYHQGVFMHGAVIAHRDCGIIFTASPGGGKSTQADLWQQRLDAEIINGDKAMIRLTGNDIMVYGSPWSGSSDFKINKGVPLKAVILLVKGTSNVMDLVEGAALLPQLSVHTYFPYWHKALINSTMRGLDTMLKKVSVYRLICRPDEEAVLLAQKMIFGQRDKRI